MAIDWDLPLNLSTHELYNKYNDAGPVPVFIVLSVVSTIISLAGIILNLSLLYVTIRHRGQLNSTSNYLLALNGVAVIAHQSGNLQFPYFALIGHNFIPYLLATKLKLHSYFGMVVSCAVTAALAIDRLFSAVYSDRHSTLNKRPYLSIWTLICCALGATLTLDAYLYAEENAKWPVSAFYEDVVTGRVGIHFIIFVATTHGIALLCYAVMWLYMRKRQDTSKTAASIFKCLIILLFLVVVGYLITSLIQGVIFELVDIDPVHEWLISSFEAALCLDAVIGMAPLILFIFSQAYRKAYTDEFPFLARGWCCSFIPISSNNAVGSFV